MGHRTLTYVVAVVFVALLAGAAGTASRNLMRPTLVAEQVADPAHAPKVAVLPAQVKVACDPPSRPELRRTGFDTALVWCRDASHDPVDETGDPVTASVDDSPVELVVAPAPQTTAPPPEQVVSSTTQPPVVAPPTTPAPPAATGSQVVVGLVVDVAAALGGDVFAVVGLPLQ